jgi:putative membrane protein
MATGRANAAPARADESTGSDRFEVRPTADSHFAWLRTRMSMERTLMSWVRTGTALIGFGFTIVQFLERLDTGPGATTARLPQAPRYVGLALMLTGTLALLVAVSQYRRLLRHMWQPGFRVLAGLEEGKVLYAPTLLVTWMLILIGIFASAVVILRVP